MSESIKNLLKKAEQGDAQSQFLAGMVFEKGLGIEKDIVQALVWYQKAMDQGHREAKGQFEKLTGSTQKTTSQPAGQKTMKEVLDEAGKNGSAEDQQRIAQSAYMMARMSLSGTGPDGMPVEKNARAAFEYMQYAAEYGLPEAQCDLALLYSEGIGTAKDNYKAFEWFRKSADQGYALAMHNVAAYYLNVFKNQQLAFQWYRKAAEAGHESSQTVVGLMYIKGAGGTPDIQQAMTWLQRAAASGSEEAKQVIAALQQEFGRQHSPSRSRDYGYGHSAKTHIASRIKSIIAVQLGKSESEIWLNTTLSNLGADSLDAVELVMAIEDEFEIEITDRQAERITTVQDAVDFVAASLKRRSF